MKNRPYPLYEVDAITDLRQMIALKAKDHPSSYALAYFLRDDIRYVSYSSFYKEVMCLGNQILTDNRFGRHIGILGENSYEWLLAFFAIINSGRVAVLFDKDMDTEEINDLSGKFEVDSLFYSSKSKNKVPDESILYSVCLDDTHEMIDHAYENSNETDNPYESVSIDPFECCCIFFTSGTTGERKGVMLSHANLASDIVGSSRLFRLEGNTYTVLPFHHAFGLIVGVLMVFHYGYTVYLSSGLKRIRKELALAQPQTMMLVPLFIENFEKQIRDTAKKENREHAMRMGALLCNLLYSVGIDIRKKVFKSVKGSFGGNLEFIICGGAALDRRYIELFRTFGIEILCGYGTTECSPCVGVNRNHYHKDGTVGVAIPGSEVRMDDSGEILIRGPHVMLGYYKNDSATKEVLTEDGWYRSGDLGRIDDDGFITLTGRKKNLIILSNGENVSPEELEDRIRNIEGVDEVLVSEENGRIKAEVYSSDSTLRECVIKGIDELNRKLPPYKRIESTAFRDEEFEKTTSMKIKR